MNRGISLPSPVTLLNHLDPTEVISPACLHSLFDLCLNSELRLSCLRDIQAVPSQLVVLRVSKPWNEWKNLASLKWDFTGSACDRYNRPQLTGFRNQQGYLIAVQRGLYFVDRSLSEVSFRPFLYSGPQPWGNSAVNVLAGRQQLAGYFTFHGNALVLSGRGIMLFGTSGTGKSTLTTALVSRGAKVISEDITCLVQSGNESIILPGPASIRLESEVARSLGFDPDGLLKAPDNSGKLVLAHKLRPEFFFDGTFPLVAGYCLHREEYYEAGRCIRIAVASQHDALMNLLRSCLGLYLLDIASQGKVLENLSYLSGTFCLKHLHYGSSLKRLFEVCQHIEKDVASL